MTLLAYATYKQDPVLMVGQAANLFVYARRLLLIFRERREVSLAGRGG